MTFFDYLTIAMLAAMVIAACYFNHRMGKVHDEAKHKQ